MKVFIFNGEAYHDVRKIEVQGNVIYEYGRRGSLIYSAWHKMSQARMKAKRRINGIGGGYPRQLHSGNPATRNTSSPTSHLQNEASLDVLQQQPRITQPVSDARVLQPADKNHPPQPSSQTTSHSSERGTEQAWRNKLTQSIPRRKTGQHRTAFWDPVRRSLSDY
jgi:hypothetical protein